MHVARLAPIAAITVVLMLLAGGCGSGGSDDTSSSPEPTKAEVDAQYVAWLKETNVGIQGMSDALADAVAARDFSAKGDNNAAIASIDKARRQLDLARTQFEGAEVQPALEEAEGAAIDEIQETGGAAFDHAEATMEAWRSAFAKLSRKDLDTGVAELGKAAASIETSVRSITRLNAKHCPSTGCDLR